MSTASTLGTIEAFLQRVNGLDKQAADPLSEPGSRGGETSHPSKNVDDRLEEATTGARAKENERDVKDDQGAPSVENAPEAKAGGDNDPVAFLSRFAKRAGEGAVSQAGSAHDDHLNIGMCADATGEDPSHETSSAKGGKEDGGYKEPSTHPARTDNDELAGGKYAFDNRELETMPIEKLAATAKELGEALMANLSWDLREHNKQAAAAPAARNQDAQLAHQAGWEMAGLVGGKFDKAAADAMVVTELEATIKAAQDDAERLCDYLDAYTQTRKQAGEDDGGGDDPSGGAPPADGMPPGGGGGGGGDESAMMGALGGSAPPDAGGQGAPPGGPQGAGGADPTQGGGDPQQAEIQQMLQIMQQAGITPEELMQAINQEQVGTGPTVTASDKAAAAKAGSVQPNVLEYFKELVARSRAAK